MNERENESPKRCCPLSSPGFRPPPIYRNGERWLVGFLVCLLVGRPTRSAWIQPRWSIVHSVLFCSVLPCWTVLSYWTVLRRSGRCGEELDGVERRAGVVAVRSWSDWEVFIQMIQSAPPKLFYSDMSLELNHSEKPCSNLLGNNSIENDPSFTHSNDTFRHIHSEVQLDSHSEWPSVNNQPIRLFSLRSWLYLSLRKLELERIWPIEALPMSEPCFARKYSSLP
ncbi:hypothetical protein RJT34_21514 [Clitoria ternatea]|uniref:Uncharacterized protein n=1 Tax=Clitoria ternatea TaxID=43366 RepID=A0AAN9P5R8_CLITE